MRIGASGLNETANGLCFSHDENAILVTGSVEMEGEEGNDQQLLVLKANLDLVFDDESWAFTAGGLALEEGYIIKPNKLSHLSYYVAGVSNAYGSYKPYTLLLEDHLTAGPVLNWGKVLSDGNTTTDDAPSDMLVDALTGDLVVTGVSTGGSTTSIFNYSVSEAGSVKGRGFQDANLSFDISAVSIAQKDNGDYLNSFQMTGTGTNHIGVMELDRNLLPTWWNSYYLPGQDVNASVGIAKGKEDEYIIGTGHYKNSDQTGFPGFMTIDGQGDVVRFTSHLAKSDFEQSKCMVKTVNGFLLRDDLKGTNGFTLVKSDWFGESSCTTAGTPISTTLETTSMTQRTHVLSTLENDVRYEPTSVVQVINAVDDCFVEEEELPFEDYTMSTEDLQAEGGDGAFKVYPNPAKASIFVASTTRSEARIQLLNASGQMLEEQIIGANSIVGLDIASCPPGMYMVKIISHSGIKVTKVVKN